MTLQLLLLWGLTASLSAALVMCPHVEGSWWSKVWQYMSCSPWVSWIAVNCVIHFTWVNLLFFAQCVQVSITLSFQRGPAHSVCSQMVQLPLFSDICTSLYNQRENECIPISALQEIRRQQSLQVSVWIVLISSVCFTNYLLSIHSTISRGILLNVSDFFGCHFHDKTSPPMDWTRCYVVPGDEESQQERAKQTIPLPFSTANSHHPSVI